MKKWISYGIMCLVIPLIIAIGTLFGERNWAFISLCVAIMACIPLFIGFEKREKDTTRLVIIAVMVALSVVGRMVFAVIPSFKPVTALVIIAAIYMGSESGFMVGALSAIISNFYFGQGAWTPFQMFIWGFIGFIAGLIAQPLKRSKILLSIYGIISGIVFSLLMDIWSVIWADGFFNISRYFALVITSLPMVLIYAVSNVVFILLLMKPMGRIFDRLKMKYGI